MQDEPYKVFSVPATLHASERRGTRTKYWVRIDGSADEWLLKIPRAGTGEHWAEKVASEVGRLIGVNCAQVELARYVAQSVFSPDTGEGREREQGQETLATICKSFLPVEYDADTEYDFIHGWEVLQLLIEGYDTNRRFGQRDHNIKNITVTLAQLMGVNSVNPMPLWDHTLEHLASYALLDGFIGNTDRHHENWMIAFVIESGNGFIETMPSYDHASSLGRELSDDKRLRILESNGVLRYLQLGRGGVYVDNRRKHALSPLRLARLLCRWRPGFMHRTLDRIDNVSELQIRTVIERVPAEFMSDIAKEFACQVVLTSKQELLRSI